MGDMRYVTIQDSSTVQNNKNIIKVTQCFFRLLQHSLKDAIHLNNF